VRQAFEYAMDRPALAKIAGQYVGKSGTGGNVACYQLAMPEDSFYNKDLAPRQYNVAKAKQLLTDAGYPNGFSTTIYVTAGQPMDVPQAMQAYLAAVNIKADLVVADQAKLTSLRTDGWQNALIPGTGGPMGRLNQWENNYRTGVNYRSMYRPDGLDAAITAAVSKVDLTERSQMQQGLMKLFYDNAMGFPLNASYEMQAYDPSLRFLPDHYVHPTTDSYFAENWVDYAQVWIQK
jgi:ABC-type transport system substrate-binding protein